MIFKSPFPDVEIPDVPVTSHVLRRVDELADRTALIDAASGQTLSFGELRSAIRRTAGGLAARGFGSGFVSLIDCRLEPGRWPMDVVLPGFGRQAPAGVFVRGVPGGSLERVILRLDILHAL
ncbi:MAG: hypothetical protein ACOC8K_05015, partial [Gemmatimonadota bacterium]